MKVHLVNKKYGTLTGKDGKPLGRIGCVEDPYQRLGLQSVRFSRRGVTCKRCLAMNHAREAPTRAKEILG